MSSKIYKKSIFYCTQITPDIQASLGISDSMFQRYKGSPKNDLILCFDLNLKSNKQFFYRF
jgi:hypothetical protein